MTDPVESSPRPGDLLPEGENPFWRFSLRLYRRSGVPAACLDLQDRAGWDVNLLLFALWAGGDCGAALSLAELDRIDGEIAAWRAEVVRPLRGVRRRVKAEDAGLYDRLKADELRAEQIQQSRMCYASGLISRSVGQNSASRNTASQNAASKAARLAAAAANLDMLLATKGITDADQLARAALLEAMEGLLAEQTVATSA